MQERETTAVQTVVFFGLSPVPVEGLKSQKYFDELRLTYINELDRLISYRMAANCPQRFYQLTRLLDSLQMVRCTASCTWLACMPPSPSGGERHSLWDLNMWVQLVSRRVLRNSRSTSLLKSCCNSYHTGPREKNAAFRSVEAESVRQEFDIMCNIFSCNMSPENFEFIQMI